MRAFPKPQLHDRPRPPRHDPARGMDAVPAGLPERSPPRASLPAVAPYPNEHVWRRIFRDGDARLHRFRRSMAWLPAPPRCNVCHIPFAGAGGVLLRLCGSEPSARNRRYCNRCEQQMQRHPGATDLVLSIVVADVRGSTTLAERAERAGDRGAWVQRLRRFTAEVQAAIEATDGFVVDVVGDEVVGVYPPGLCGDRYATLALAAARRLVHLGAHDRAGAGAPPLPFGVGVETGEVCLGNRFSEAEQPTEEARVMVRVIGDRINVAARLASAAAAGEALVSDATMTAAELQPAATERRRISVAGRDAPVGVHVLRAS